MATSLTKNGIESAIVRVRAQPSGRIELRDDKEAGLVFCAGERSSTWSLAVRLQDGQRSRIKLGTWPGMGIAEARAAARVARTQIDQGSNPDERKREIISGRVASPETSGASNWSAITIVAAKPVRPRSRRLGATVCRAGACRACRRRPPDHSFAARRGRPAACLSPVVPAFVWPRGPRLRAVQARRNPRAAPRSSDRADRPDRRTGHRRHRHSGRHQRRWCPCPTRPHMDRRAQEPTRRRRGSPPRRQGAAGSWTRVHRSWLSLLPRRLIPE